MPAWSQEKGGPLSEGEIDDLVAFILSEESAPSPRPEDMEAEETITPFGAWLRGWGGVLLFVVLLVITLGGAILFQRRREGA